MAYSSRLERTGRLKGLELQVDVARIDQLYIPKANQGICDKKVGNYHPAALERAADRMQGVSTQVLGGGDVLDPIF